MGKIISKTALSILVVPMLAWGCTKSQNDAKDPAQELKDGKVLTSTNVTNFDGLSVKIKQERIPDQAIICTVGSDAINVGDYKREFRFRQEQAKEMLKQSPVPPPKLLKDAKKQGFTLSERERHEFLQAAYKKGGTKLEEQIKAGSVNKELFEKNVLDMGIILKAVNAGIEKQLLTEIINNSLLLNAARKNGLGKVAFNKYIEIKHSPKYKEYLRTTKLTPNQLKDQLLEEILVNLMKQRIIDKAIVSDKDVFKYYQNNKEKYRHNGRIRWSQILISDSDRDFQAVLSIRSIVERKYPKLSVQQKLEKIQELKEKQKNHAMELVKQATNGADFAKLANENTDDIPARASKTGGDMGYVNLDELAYNKLFQNVANSLKTMVVGEVYPKPIKSMLGWHIIKLTDKQKAGIKPFDEVKDSVKLRMVQFNSGAAVLSWIMQQREVVPVKISKRFERFISEANNLNLKGEDAPKKTSENEKSQKPKESSVNTEPAKTDKPKAETSEKKK